METQNKTTQYEKSKGHSYVAPLSGPWEDDLWYYDVFDPKYLLNKLELSYENSKERK